MKELRPYQQECVDTVFRELEDGVTRQLVVLPTGAGKTRTAVAIIKKFKKILWLSHVSELINQSALAILSEYLDEDHIAEIKDKSGIIRYLDSQKNNSLFVGDIAKKITSTIGVIKQDLFNINNPITVASVQTLHRRLELIPPDHFDLIVLDEAHLFLSPSFFKAVSWFQPKLLLSLTATPKRLDGISLTDISDKIVYQKDIKFCIDNGYLCHLEAILVETKTSLDKIGKVGGDLNQKDLGETIDSPERNQLIFNKWVQYAKGRKTLGFGINIQHIVNLTKIFNDNGVRATFVVSDKSLCSDDERIQRIIDFEKGLYEILFSVGIMGTGVDIPNISCILMGRPTMSETLYRQFIGRGGRLKTEDNSFKNCLILDIVDVTSKHDLINTYTLEEDVPIKDKVFISEEKKEELLIIEMRMQQERRMKEIERDQRVVLIPLPKVRIDDTMRNREDATVAQKDWLQKEGYDTVNTHWTKGQASEVLSNLKASSFKIEELKRLGYDVKHGATIGQHKLAVERGSREIAFEKAARARGMNGLPLYNIL